MSEYKPNPIMHDQYDAVLLSLSAIALMASHPYNYWKTCIQLSREKSGQDADSRQMFRESAERCEKIMRRTCELLDEVMQYIGDCNNAVDAADDHGNTNAAFDQMNRALGRPTRDDLIAAAAAARAEKGQP